MSPPDGTLAEYPCRKALNFLEGWVEASRSKDSMGFFPKTSTSLRMRRPSLRMCENSLASMTPSKMS